MILSLRFWAGLLALAAVVSLAAAADLRIGLIGLDTSHVIVVAKAFNDPADKDHLPGAHVVCGYKGGSPDVKESWSRVDGFTAELQDKYGVAMVESIAEVAARSDALMIESVDGRTHLAQAREAFKSGKPVFIDKPFAGSLRDAVEIVRLARETGTPVFSASNYRFVAGVRRLHDAKIGRVRGAICYGSAEKEPHVPDLYFYGVHGTEALYTIMGLGCETVSRVATPDTDIVTGLWSGGRTGVFYGLRGGRVATVLTVFGAKEILSEKLASDHPALNRQILAFFRTRRSPVSLEDTLEVMTFLEAADESKRQGGAPVSLKEVLAKNSPL